MYQKMLIFSKCPLTCIPTKCVTATKKVSKNITKELNK
jgi:hypothetical protein